MIDVNAKILDSFLALKNYCEAEEFKGWDPYDGLNSKVFKALPLVGRSAICRLVWIQLFKRCPINIRKLLLVPKQYNAKAVGLFLHGYVNIYKLIEKNVAIAPQLGTKQEILAKINLLAEKLIEMQSPNVSGAAWGYNFPWQCRREFLFPANEPTVVATYFCASALFEAYDVTGNERYKATALTSSKFVLNDLHRTPYANGFLFSYSKMPGNDTIYNASLLGSYLLCLCYKYSGDKQLLESARKSIDACCAAQGKDGEWTYGVKRVTGWIDSFHTGYNLMALAGYQDITGDTTYANAIEKGLAYYLKTFFNADGSSNYYHNRQFPIDIHCPGQLWCTLASTGTYAANSELAKKVADWTIDNMMSPHGFFYYQLKKGVNTKISYMRWSNAFMFSALSSLLVDMCAE